MLIDLAQYKPTLEVGASSVPESMRWEDEVEWRAQAEELIKEEDELRGAREAIGATSRGTRFASGPYIQI